MPERMVGDAVREAYRRPILKEPLRQTLPFVASAHGRKKDGTPGVLRRSRFEIPERNACCQWTQGYGPILSAFCDELLSGLRMRPASHTDATGDRIG